MLVAAIVYIVPEVVVRSSTMVLEWGSSPKALESRHFLLIGYGQGRSYHLVSLWRHHLDIHRLEGSRRPFRPSISLKLATRARSHGKLCLQLLRLCRDGHLLGDLIHNELPLLPDAWVAMLGGQVLLDHLDDLPVLLHRQSVVAQDCILPCHLEFVEELSLHLA